MFSDRKKDKEIDKMSETRQALTLCYADGKKIKDYESRESAAIDNDMTVERVDYFTKRGRKGETLTFSGKYFRPKITRKKKEPESEVMDGPHAAQAVELMDIEAVMRDLYDANSSLPDERSGRLLEGLLRAMYFVLQMLHTLVTRLDPAKEKKGRPRKTVKPVVAKEPVASSDSEKDPFEEMVEPAQPPAQPPVSPLTEDEDEPAPKKRAPRKKAEKPAESEGESDGEKPAPKKRAPRKKAEKPEAEEAVKVVRINEQGKKVAKTYKGLTYLKASDNVLYNDNQEQVGRWDEDSKQVVLNAPDSEEEENPEDYE